MADIISKKGAKVGVIFSTDPKTKVVEFLGYGVYKGKFIPKEAAGFIAQWCRENNKLNPRIKLDNGKIIYGCEAWFGSAMNIKKYLKELKEDGWKIVKVDIDDIRKSLLEVMKNG